MNKQIEALRLADAIQLGWLENVDADKADIDMIQAELRRLHEVNADLLDALKRLLASDDNIAQATDDILLEAVNDTEGEPLLREQAAALLQARAAIAKATGVGV